MKVTILTGSQVNVEMTVDELLSIRYALREGCDKLKSSAIFFKQMGPSTIAKSSKKTADKCWLAMEELESACQNKPPTPYPG